jgi:hypothetical protein
MAHSYPSKFYVAILSGVSLKLTRIRIYLYAARPISSSAREAWTVLGRMTVFMWDEFDVLVSSCRIISTFKAMEQSKKTVQQVAKEQSEELRSFYLYYLI